MVNGNQVARFGVGRPAPPRPGRFGALARRAPTPRPTARGVVAPRPLTQEQQRQQQLLQTNQALLLDAQQQLARANQDIRERFEGGDQGTREILIKTQNTFNARRQALQTVVSRIRGGESFTQQEIERFVGGRESRVITRLEAERVRGRDVERLQERIGASTPQAALQEQRDAQQRLKGVLKGRPVSQLTITQAQELTPRQRRVLGITITRPKAPTETFEQQLARDPRFISRTPTGFLFRENGVTREVQAIQSTAEGIVFRDITPKEQITVSQVAQSGVKDFFREFTRGDVTLSESGVPGAFLLPFGEQIKLADIRSGLRGEPISRPIPETDILGRPLTKKQKETLLRQRRQRRFVGGVAAEFVPVSRVELGVLAAAPILIAGAPPVVRIPVSGGIAGLGVKQAADVSLTPEQRVASGIIALAAGTGFVFEAAPFAKGLLPIRTTRIVTKAGKTTEVKFLEGVAIEEGKIGLIPESKGLPPAVAKKLGFSPAEGALERGGFGFPLREQVKGLVGKELKLVTAQRGLLTRADVGKIVLPDEAISPKFFFTPADPVTGLPQARVSRLGLSDLLKFPQSIRLGFGLPKRPQILVSRAERIRRGELTPGTELEVLKGAFAVERELPSAVIKGQKVDVFEVTFDIGKTKIPKAQTVTKIPSSTITPPLVVQTTGVLAAATAPIVSRRPPTVRIRPAITRPIAPSLPTVSLRVPSIGVTRPTRGRVVPPTRPISLRTVATTPLTSPTLAPSRPPTRPPTRVTPTRRPPTRVARRTPTRPLILPRARPPPRRQPILPPSITQGIRRKKLKDDDFLLEIRRFGKFRPVAKLPTLERALKVGRKVTQRTLARTLRVTSISGKKLKGVTSLGPRFRLPVPKSPLAGRPITLIQRRRFALAARTEIKEIQTARRRSRK